jgi:CTP-dependent riboflavin kinase
MKKVIISCFIICMAAANASAQIDFSNLKLDNILGKVLNVKRGFAPKFSLGKISIPKIAKVAEVIGLKKSTQAIKLFNTFKTGRTVYKIASYAGSAIAAYSAIKAIDKSTLKEDYQKPLVGALSTIATGLVVKFLTKGASYKAVDVFNGVVKKKLKDILSVAPASSTMGMGVYVKL